MDMAELYMQVLAELEALKAGMAMQQSQHTHEIDVLRTEMVALGQIAQTADMVLEEQVEALTEQQEATTEVLVEVLAETIERVQETQEDVLTVQEELEEMEESDDEEQANEMVVRTGRQESDGAQSSVDSGTPGPGGSGEREVIELETANTQQDASRRREHTNAARYRFARGRGAASGAQGK